MEAMKKQGPVEAGLRQADELWRRSPTRGAYARSGDGEAVHPEQPEAVSFCATGALMRCLGDGSFFVAISVMKDACWGIVSHINVAAINDETEHMGDVFSEAIEAASELGL
jgi:hypothetical protein